MEGQGGAVGLMVPSNPGGVGVVADFVCLLFDICSETGYLAGVPIGGCLTGDSGPVLAVKREFCPHPESMLSCCVGRKNGLYLGGSSTSGSLGYNGVASGGSV